MGGAESISQSPSPLTKEQLLKVLTRTDVFLTHDWGHELGQDNHAKVGMINKLIKARGLSTWFDEEKMEGNIIEQMAAGIENAQCVVVFITKRYVDKVVGTNSKDNCQLEFYYSAIRKGANKMIAVVMEERMKNISVWVGGVGIILASRLYVDMTGDFGDSDYLNRCVDDLYRRIIKVIGKPVPTIDVNIIPNIHTPNNFINNNKNKDDYYLNLFSKCRYGDLNSFNELESQSRIEVENIVCLGYLMIILNENIHTPNNIPKDKERSKSIGREIIGKLKEKERSSSLNHHEEFILDVIYYYGIEVNKDYEEAVKWYGLSSNQGYSNAQYNNEFNAFRNNKTGGYSLKYFIFIISLLFLLLSFGLIIQYPPLNNSKLDEPTSQNSLIVDQGNSHAQLSLGESGKGVEKDIEEAVKRFKSSADKGYSKAKSAFKKFKKKFKK